ncbi:hypothetical protein FGO68_gene6043 [Halteria grandinella]|uniref:Uncharacterized protein n=1 Tax=Halteria grandinella TaxID=5974 RepID=A0A8J8P048_HALGN|nr:hypothetical protein FGO68_gene6043 [Halteria grandinella]
MIKFTYNSGQAKPSLRPNLLRDDNDVSPTGLRYSEVEQELINEHIKLKESISQIKGGPSRQAQSSYSLAQTQRELLKKKESKEINQLRMYQFQ